MAGRDGRGPAGAGPGTGRGAGLCKGGAGLRNGNSGGGFFGGFGQFGTGRNGKGVCRRLSGNGKATGVFYNKDNEINELRHQAEILGSSLNEINKRLKELEENE